MSDRAMTKQAVNDPLAELQSESDVSNDSSIVEEVPEEVKSEPVIEVKDEMIDSFIKESNKFFKR